MNNNIKHIIAREIKACFKTIVISLIAGGVAFGIYAAINYPEKVDEKILERNRKTYQDAQDEKNARLLHFIRENYKTYKGIESGTISKFDTMSVEELMIDYYGRDYSSIDSMDIKYIVESMDFKYNLFGPKTDSERSYVQAPLKDVSYLTYGVGVSKYDKKIQDSDKYLNINDYRKYYYLWDLENISTHCFVYLPLLALVARWLFILIKSIVSFVKEYA